MAHKPNVENRWWVETSVKRPRKAEPAAPPPTPSAESDAPPEDGPSPAQLRIVENFYSVARDYNQDRAKEDLTDNNLRIARAALSSTTAAWCGCWCAVRSWKTGCST